MFRMMIAAGLLATTSYATPAERQTGWTANAIPWQTTGANGTKFALLEGERDKAGMPFSYAFFIPAGVWDSPHHHSATARVFVARGSLKIGYGTAMNRSKVETFPAGSYLVFPAGAVHFDGADEDTLIIGTAVGPWATAYHDGSAPASAGTPIRQ